MENEQEAPEPQTEDAESRDVTEYQTLANGILNPRHRRFCHLVAQGQTVAQIKAELGYVDSRISTLKRNPYIMAEVARLQNKIFEESVQTRMKTFAEPALANIEQILTDRTNRVKTSEKMALSQWVVEKLDGKAAQKHDIGENLLGVLMDRLDAKKTAGPSGSSSSVIDVTPTEDSAPLALPPAPKSQEEDELAAWVREFASTTSVE